MGIEIKRTEANTLQIVGANEECITLNIPEGMGYKSLLIGGHNAIMFYMPGSSFCKTFKIVNNDGFCEVFVIIIHRDSLQTLKGDGAIGTLQQHRFVESKRIRSVKLSEFVQDCIADYQSI